MKKIFLLFAFFGALACNNASEEKTENPWTPEVASEEADTLPNFGIVIHGGAGTILKENMSDSLEQLYRAKLEEAVRAGHAVLERGGTSIEAIEQAINIMEDSPLFNAGKGAVFTNAETNELDAAVMDGETLNAGAVAGVTTVKNPIDLAIAVMKNSEHVMMIGKGAETFAEEQGMEIVDPKYFYTENRFRGLQRIKESEKTQLDHDQKTAFWIPISRILNMEL